MSKPRKTRIVLIVILVLIAVGGALAYRLWNKPRPQVADQQSLAIPAAQLYREFSTAEADANAKYLDKVIEVSGTVTNVSSDQSGGTVLLLAAGAPAEAIQCAMSEKAAFSTGQSLRLKGFCKAYMAPMLDGDTGRVLLNECILVKE